MNHAMLFPGREPTKVTAADMLPHIDAYFAAIRAEFDRASGGNPDKSYKLGVYGSGLVNLHMKNNPAVSYFWLAQSSGWGLSIRRQQAVEPVAAIPDEMHAALV